MSTSETTTRQAKPDPKTPANPRRKAAAKPAAKAAPAAADMSQTAADIANGADPAEVLAETPAAPAEDKPKRRRNVTTAKGRPAKAPKAKAAPRPKIADLPPGEALQASIDRMGQKPAKVFADLANVLASGRDELQPVLEAALAEKSDQAFGLALCGTLSYLWRVHRGVRLATADGRGVTLIELQKRS